MRNIQSVYKKHVTMFQIAIAVLATTIFLASPAQAEIVYTHVDIVINEGTYNLDINGDGVVDLVITSGQSGICAFGQEEQTYLFQTSPSGNGVILGPLKAGAQIGPNQTFSGGMSYLATYMWDPSPQKNHYILEGSGGALEWLSQRLPSRKWLSRTELSA